MYMLSNKMISKHPQYWLDDETEAAREVNYFCWRFLLRLSILKLLDEHFHIMANLYVAVCHTGHERDSKYIK
jgi:hypothetical protein